VRCTLVRFIRSTFPKFKSEHLVTLNRLGVGLQTHQGVVNTIGKPVLQIAVLIIVVLFKHLLVHPCLINVLFSLGLFLVEYITLEYMLRRA